ncbi:MAG: PKD domain-containing protein [Bacteroidales bacterium]|nr:MAG: PKD domain-containing protein [Bacteroidales bacterium]
MLFDYKYKSLVKILIVVALLLSSLVGSSQTDTEFWFSAPEVNRYHSGGNAEYPAAGYGNVGSPVYLHLTSFDKAANITISMPANTANFNGGVPISVSLPANTTQRIDLSPYVGDDIAGMTAAKSMENRLKWTTSNLAGATPYINRNNKGILVQSDNNITAYYEIGVLYNMDLISLKGRNALGKKFYVPFQTTHNTRSYPYNFRPYSSIDIVATENNTKIRITTPYAIWVRGVGSKAAGTHTIWLNAGETSIITAYEAHAGFDYQTSFSNALRLAGSYVEVDEVDPLSSGGSISVISHDDLVRSSVTLNPDYVTDQLVPIDLIGVDYAVIQGVGFSAADIEDHIFVVGTQAATTFTVKTGPAATTTIYNVGAGGSVTVPLTDNNWKVATIKSNKPVYTYHMSGVGHQRAGALIPTISNCTGSGKVAFNRTRGGSYAFYLNILVWNTAIGDFRLLKNNLDVSTAPELAVLNTINNPASFNSLPETGIPYSNWSYARIDASQLTPGVAYLLVNDENVFHLGVINGHTDDNAFYGYFSNFNQFKVDGSVGPSVNPQIKLCYGSSTQLSAIGGTKFTWSPITFLNDPNIYNPKVIFPTVTTKYKVLAYGACNLKDSAYVTVNVSLPLTPSFTADTLYGCGDLPVNFENTSTGNPTKLYWYWKVKGAPNPGTLFKSSNLLAVPLPADAHKASHTFSNTTSSPITYTVNLLVESTSCSKVDSVNIIVYPKVAVAPTVSVNNGCQPLNVQFFAHPTGYTGTASIDWDFGDSGSSSLENPYHTYINNNSVSNTFTSKVTLTDQWNVCSASSNINVTVQPFIKASFVVNEVEGCSPFTINIVNDSRGGISQWFWDRDGDGFDDFTGSGSGPLTLTNPTTTNTPLNVPIRLRVTNAWGCSDAITRTIKVFPQAVINTYNLDNHGNAQGCSPLNMDFAATTTNATIFHWLIDGNAFDNTLTANYNFENFGAADVVKTASFTANNEFGCSVTQTSNITIRPFVDAQFTADKEVGCSSLPVNFLNASSLGSSSFQWYIDGALFASTTNIPAQLFNNPTVTNIPRIIPVRLVASNLAGCTDDLTKNIVVNPQSTSSFTYTDAGNLNHCSPFSTTFDTTGLVTNADSYQWEFGTYGASNLVNPAFNFTNDGTADVTVPVTLTTNNSFGCPAVSTQNIIVRPGVKALFSLDKTAGCPPYNATVSATMSAAIANYTWDFDGVPYTGPNQIFANPSNLTGLDDTKNITLTVSNGFCSDATTKSIVVYPQVDAQYTASILSGCSPLTVNFASQSELYGTHAPISNIVWDFKDNSTAITTPITHTFVNPDHTTPQVFNVTLTATSDKGCVETETVPITVNPNVNAAFNSMVIQPCTPVRINVKDVSFAGPTISTFTWSYPGGVLLPPEDKDFDIDFDNIDPLNPVNRTITLAISNTYGCTSSKSQTFTIDPKVSAVLTLTAPVDGGGTPIDRLCAPAKFTFSNNSTGVDLTYTWDFKDGVTQTTNTKDPFVHTFENRTAATKQFDVQLTAVNLKGCTSSSTRSVWAYPEVDAKFSMTRDSSCTPFYIKLKDESLNGTQWSWDFGHTILGIPQTRTSIVSGETFTKLIDNETVADQIKNYRIKLTLDDLGTGCRDTISQLLEVYPRVISNFTLSPISGCSPTTVTFTNNSTGLGSYLWELDNGLSFNQAVPDPLSISNASTVNEKIIRVKLTATNPLSCKSVSNKSVTIAPDVIASYTSSILEGCDPFTANFTNLAPSISYNYEWTVNGAVESILQDYSRVFTNLSNPPVINTYNVQLKSAYKNNAACFKTASRIITVNPRVYPNFNFTNSDDCHPLTTDINNSTLSYNNSATYTWNLGNGTFSTLASLTDQLYKNNSATKDTTYSIKLVARSVHQCVDSISKTVTVHPRPIASYIMNNESVFCSPFPIELHNHSNGQEPLSYSFDLGDGTIINTLNKSQIIHHTYRNFTSDNKDYNITLTTTTSHGCQNSTSQTVYAYPEVTARFSIPQSADCSPFTVVFNNTTDNGYFYVWNFKDGTNSNLMSPSHRFVNITENDKIFDVHLRSISAYDCEDDTIIPVTVYATPVANFSVNPPLKIFPDATFNFHNQSFPAADAWSYNWNFGDGYTSTLKEAGNHTYTQWAPNSNDNIYTATLKVDAPHCSSTTSNILRLLPTVPVPFFDANIYQSCSPLEVHFVNASMYGRNYVWDFGDGTTSGETEPVHIFTEPGYYVVKLQVQGDGGTSFYYKTFRVYQNPIASFAVYPNRVMLPNAEVHVYNLTKYAHRYDWELDGVFFSNDKDPVIKFDQLGEYQIGLRAFSHDTLGGCQDYTSVSPAVWVEGEGMIKFPDAFIPSKGGSNGGVYDDIDYKNEVFHPIHYGVVEYKLMIFNRWGEQIFQSDDIKKGWDGYFKSKLCDQGVYIWRAIGKYTNGRSFDKKGNVTLLR